MRSVAQPVAVLTAWLPSQSTSKDEDEEQERLVHGATISSFTTISMHPPLVAFSLRTPSRIADALQASGKRRRTTDHGAHFLINLLARGQGDVAAAFARPGLPPLAYDAAASRLRTASTPSSTSAEHHPTLDLSAWRSASTINNVPALGGTLAALSCSLEGKLDLATARLGIGDEQHSLIDDDGEDAEDMDKDDASEAAAPAVIAGNEAGQAATSELFIARVCAVERPPAPSSASHASNPLVYCRQSFWTIGNGSS